MVDMISNFGVTIFLFLSSFSLGRFFFNLLILGWLQICGKKERHSTLLSLLQSDAPQSAIIFVGEQVSITYLSQCFDLCRLETSHVK